MAVSYQVGPDGIETGTVSFSWDPVNTAEDGSDFVVQSYLVELSTDDGVTWNTCYVGHTGDTNGEVSGLPVPLSGLIRVTPVGINGESGDPSPATSFDLIVDLDAPGVPTAATVTSDFHLLTVKWDGSLTDGIPDDFDRVVVTISQTSGDLPSDTNQYGYLREAGSLPIPDLPTDVDLYVRLSAVDKRGNWSDPSDEVVAQVHQLVDANAIIDELDGAKIQDGTIVASDKVAANSIVTANLAALSVTAAKMAANTITADQIAAGAITATTLAANAVTAAKLAATAIDGKTITGATVQSGTGTTSVVRMDSGGLRVYNGSGYATANLSTSGAFDFQTAASGDYVRFYSNKGLELYNNGTQVFFLDATTGNISMTGASISAGSITGGTVLGATVGTSLSGNRIVLNSTDLRVQSDSFVYHIFQTSGNFRIESAASGARIRLSPSGLEVFNTAGTRSVYLSAVSGNADFTNCSITGGIMTGGQIRTSASGKRIELGDGTNGSYSGGVAVYGSDSRPPAYIYAQSDRQFVIQGPGGVNGTDIGAFRIYDAGGAGTANQVEMVLGLFSGQGGSTSVIRLGPAGSARQLYTYTDDTTASAANVRVDPTTNRFYLVTSVRGAKDNIQTINTDYSILDLPAVTFQSKSEIEAVGADKAKTAAGFIAEDVEEAGFHALVDYKQDGTVVGVQYDRVSAYLIPVIADMNKRIKELETAAQGDPSGS